MPIRRRRVELDVTLLGGFGVRVDGRAVPAAAWSRRHAAWLVKVLALAPGHRLHREQVMDHLWPDVDPDVAGPRLHKAAHFARRALGAASTIELLGDAVALGPNADVVVDAVRFREAALAALSAATTDAADEALTTYHGELLPDDRYEPWTEPHRHVLAGLYRDLLRQTRRWEELLLADPADEAAHVAIAEAHAARGDRSAALRQLDRLAENLESELGVRPGTEAVALRQRLERTAEPVLAPPAGRGLRTPRTRYADSSGHAIAYQVVGDGPRDIVFVPGFVSNIDLQWEHPGMAAFFERLSTLGRLIVFDKRATGLSERPPLDALPTLEDRMDDVRAVLDAVGSRRATVFGISEGGPMAVLFAATYPDRVDGLVIYGSFASDPFGDRLDWFTTAVPEWWGSGGVFGHLAPSWVTEEATRRFLGRYERHSATPAAAAGLLRLADEIDVTPALAGVSARTLVLHRRGDEVIAVDRGEALAGGIEGAAFVPLPGRDHLVYVDGDEVLDHVAAFLAGTAAAPPASRVLTTLLVAGVVESTGHAAELDDTQRAKLVGAFVDSSRQAIVAHRGVVRSVGDGRLLATFDGPARAVRCADEVHDLAHACGLLARCGIHTAEVEIVDDDVAGIGVDVAGRVRDAAEPGTTYVTRTVRDLVAGSGLRLVPRGSHDVPGLDEAWELYAATG